MLLEGAINALGKVGLMLNVHKDNLTAVLAVLPALKRPTISHLSDDEWLAVNTILDESTVRDIIPAAEAGGRRGHRGISAEQDRTVIRILETKQVGRLLARKAARLTEAEAVVRPILEAVRRRGDRALLEYARKFDGLERKSVRVPPGRTARAARGADARVPRAVETAAANIRAYAERQLPREWTAQLKPGLQLGQIVRPLDTVAAYIPAGRYPLPSTLMMTVIPAQVAGVPNICVACPQPVARSLRHRAPAGRAQVFQMGGAQAIAAFAFGTRTVPRADRIVGPGNIYVAAAKKLLAGEVGIDFVAGPTEILIIAADGDPRHYRRRHAGAGRARCGRLRHPADHLEAPGTRRGAAKWSASLPRCPPPPWRAKSIAKNSRDHVGALAGRSRRDLEPLRAGASEHSRRVAAARSPPRRQRLHRPVQSGSRGRLRVRPESRAAHQRRRAPARRPVRHRLREGDLGPGADPTALRKLAPAITTLARAEGLEAHARSVEVRL